MTGRLADIGARITGIGQLGSVVNAMRGIAAARAQQANSQLASADSHAATIAAAIGDVLAMLPAGVAARPDSQPDPARTALVVFCAEQGFAGAFSETVFRTIGNELHTAPVLAVGTRGTASLTERGITPVWSAAMPAHSQGVPRLAGRIAEAVYGRVLGGGIEALDAVFSVRQPGHAIEVRRRRLFPLDPAEFRPGRTGHAPLLNLPPGVLLQELTAEYLQAQLCAIALHAFAAENDARMEAMAQAHGQIDRQLASLRATLRRVRQEEITSEIVELAAGAEAAAGTAG